MQVWIHLSQHLLSMRTKQNGDMNNMNGVAHAEDWEKALSQLMHRKKEHQVNTSAVWGHNLCEGQAIVSKIKLGENLESY